MEGTGEGRGEGRKGREKGMGVDPTKFGRKSTPLPTCIWPKVCPTLASFRNVAK